MIKDSVGLKIVCDEQSNVPHTSWGHYFHFLPIPLKSSFQMRMGEVKQLRAGLLMQFMLRTTWCTACLVGLSSSWGWVGVVPRGLLTLGPAGPPRLSAFRWVRAKSLHRLIVFYKMQC